ncbi:hypothetical protein [Maridesulfovibrio salexigens]|uniref:N-acetyltransferase domain-containing protein n=1 Tax=Maridesulfovibrio salexigens (strain ATCC 14822 / DSM 2638 / NCIMB 8403 / VKM B-1763) TaxID=526222 RepID=C6BRR4_MARSD|nr:hypothetical protein [Maridesulfovibrio salexigens]ACS79504.1 hypothetical protein Desal_1442 [Maridesulfovibrio salexigens DSM 2638]
MNRVKKAAPFKLGIPTMEDVNIVAANIRESDREDMEGLHPGKSIRAIIMGDVEYSKLVYGLYRNCSIQAIFGVVPISDGVGCPWVVGSVAMDGTPLPFARASRGLLDMLQRSFPLLDTWVCSQNSRSVHWHKWCGFEFENEKVRLGRDYYFHALRRIRKNKTEMS